MRPCQGQPPLASSESMRRRNAFLDLCLGHGSEYDALRLIRLREVLQSDIQNSEIILYTATENPDLDQFADKLSELLLPAGIAKFARNRWLTTTKPLKQVALLDGTFNIFRRAVPLWIQSLGGRAAAKARAKAKTSVVGRGRSKGRGRGRRHDPPAAVTHAAWRLDSDADTPSQESDLEHQSQQVHQLVECADPIKQDFDWVAFNMHQRASASQFAATDPGPRLLLGVVCLQPCTSLMHHLEFVASKSWDLKQQEIAAATSQTLLTRMAYAQSGQMTGDFFQSVLDRMALDSHWEALSPANRTQSHRSMAFAMLATALCSVFTLIHEPHQGFPWQLWSLLQDQSPAACKRVQSTRRCLLDPFSQRFIKKFRNKLRTVEVKAVLLQLGILIRLDVLRQECRHSTIRSWLRKELATWKRALEQVSADYSLSQHRILEHAESLIHGPQVQAQDDGAHGAHGDDEGSPEKERKTAHKRKRGKSRGGGGGPQREFFSTYLREHQTAGLSPQELSTLFSSAHGEYRAQREAGGEAQLMSEQRGAAALASWRVGGPTFGTPPSRMPIGAQQQVQNALVSIAKMQGQEQSPSAEQAVATVDHLVRSERRQLRQQKAAEVAEQRRVTASLEQFAANAMPHGRANLPTQVKDFATLASGFCCQPSGCTGITHMSWVPPAREISQKALSGRVPELCAALQKAWADLHAPIKQEDCRKLGRIQHASKSVCYQAGFCMCQPTGQALRYVGNQFQLALGTALKKGSPAREVYDNAGLVLRLQNAGRSTWWYIGYGNLSDKLFTLLPLEEACDWTVRCTT